MILVHSDLGPEWSHNHFLSLSLSPIQNQTCLIDKLVRYLFSFAVKETDNQVKVIIYLTLCCSVQLEKWKWNCEEVSSSEVPEDKLATRNHLLWSLYNHRIVNLLSNYTIPTLQMTHGSPINLRYRVKLSALIFHFCNIPMTMTLEIYRVGWMVKKERKDKKVTDSIVPTNKN